MPRGKRNLSKEEIVAYASKIANEAGSFEDITLQQVADHFEVRVPSLYNHIRNAKDLQYEAGIFALNKLLDVLTQSVLGVSEEDAVRQLAHAYRTFAFDNPALYPLTIAAPREGDSRRTELAQDVVALIQIVLKPYRLSDEDSLHSIRVLRSMLHGFVDIDRCNGFGLSLSVDATFDILLDTYLQSLRPD